MRKGMMLTVLGVLFLAVWLTGCASVAPYLVDPRAYNTTVAGLNAERGQYETRILDERLKQERIGLRQNFALKDIRLATEELGAPVATSKTTTVSRDRSLSASGSPVGAEGYPGGFATILINDSRYNVSFELADSQGQKWLYKVGPSDSVVVRLETGPHFVRVYRDYLSGRPWRQTVFRVWADPVFNYQGKSYYGFCRVWGGGF